MQVVKNGKNIYFVINAFNFLLKNTQFGVNSDNEIYRLLETDAVW
jgi:hypothetical protein